MVPGNQKKGLSMKAIALSAVAVCSVFALPTHAGNWTAGMTEGKPEIKSISQLAFGPEGILFIADSKSAAVFAVSIGDTKAASGSEPLKVDGINEKIAALVGTSADQVLIDDLAVNPISHNAYLAVSRGRGPAATPVLIRAKAGGQLEAVALDKVKFSRAELPDAPTDGVVGQGNRQSNPRQEAITDIAFLDDRVLIAGLSNEEFASTLRAIPFPFKTVPNGTSVEIYHGSHGRFETRAPIRTFVPFNVGGQPQILAAYTCTPLVEIPVSVLKPGAKIKGKTIAELGNHNRPLDMIVYQKDGKDFLLLANNSRGVMKISTEHIAMAEGISEPVSDKKGQPYQTIEGWTGVEQLDLLDPTHAVVLRRGEGKALNLESLPLP
jgi:hypothetical protein